MNYPINIDTEMAAAKERNGTKFEGAASLAYRAVLCASKEAYERGYKDAMAKIQKEGKL